MRRVIPLLAAGLLAAACAAPTSTPAPTLPPPPGPVASPAESASIAVKHEDLAPYFAATNPTLEGTFLVRGDQLLYAPEAGTQQVVLTGPQPRVLAQGQHGVLLGDGQQLFWFEPATGEVREAVELGGVHTAAAWGETYLLAAGRAVYHWKEGADPVELPAPEHVYAVYGVSISPDGRYGVVAYDLDIPSGPRAGVIWAYDLLDGSIAKWPAEQPKVMYGLWLLGWSEPHTIRFMTGVRGFNRGHTWALPDGDPGAVDGTEYRAIDGAAGMNQAGSWITYRSIPEDVWLQSVSPGSKPIRVYMEKGGVDYPRFLLNGNLAFRTRHPAAWWEIGRDGSVTRWDETDQLY